MTPPGPGFPHRPVWSPPALRPQPRRPCTVYCVHRAYQEHIQTRSCARLGGRDSARSLARTAPASSSLKLGNSMYQSACPAFLGKLRILWAPMTAVAVVTRHTPSSGHALHLYTPPTTCPHWLSWDRFLPLGGEGSLSEPAFLPEEEGRDGPSAPPVPAWNTGAEGVSVK